MEEKQKEEIPPISSAPGNEPNMQDRSAIDNCNEVGNNRSRHPEAGLKTSDFYQIKNKVPERFNHPDWFEGYGTEVKNPFYQTSSNQYGSKPPSVHTLPTMFRGRSQKFTSGLGSFGMYRNHSLNTAKDRNKVHDNLDRC